MTTRKIKVVFYVPDYDCFDTRIPVARITDAQLEQLQNSVSNAKLPANACPTSISTSFTDTISFMVGGARRNQMAEHTRTLEISDLFYLAHNRATPCGKCKRTDERSMMRHCANNLRTGKCKDEFMRNTIGAVLFPQFYAKDKQK